MHMKTNYTIKLREKYLERMKEKSRIITIKKENIEPKGNKHDIYTHLIHMHTGKIF